MDDFDNSFISPDDEGLSGIEVTCYYPSPFTAAGIVTSTVGHEGDYKNYNTLSQLLLHVSLSNEGSATARASWR